MKQEEKQQKMQEKYIEMQTLDQQMKQIQQQLQVLTNQTIELNQTVEALEEFKKVKAGTEILFPVTNGIFVKGILSENKELNVNVGRDVVVGKSIDETKQLIKDQITEMEKIELEVNKDLQKLGIRAMELEKEIIELSK